MTFLPDNALPAIAASLAAAIAACIGLTASASKAAWIERRSAEISALAGGLLVSVALLHLIPHAAHESESAAYAILGGFAALFLVHNFIDAGDHRVSAVIPFLGISFHSFVDGGLYAAAFSDGLATGLSASTGLILHETIEASLLFSVCDTLRQSI